MTFLGIALTWPVILLVQWSDQITGRQYSAPGPAKSLLCSSDQTSERPGSYDLEGSIGSRCSQCPDISSQNTKVVWNSVEPWLVRGVLGKGMRFLGTPAAPSQQVPLGLPGHGGSRVPKPVRSPQIFTPSPLGWLLLTSAAAPAPALEDRELWSQAVNASSIMDSLCDLGLSPTSVSPSAKWRCTYPEWAGEWEKMTWRRSCVTSAAL